MNRHRFLALALGMLMVCISAAAENRQQRADSPHEIRVGWGDQLFETLAWNKPSYIITNMSADTKFAYKEHYRYTQHVFVEYQYRMKKWFGIGCMLDNSAFLWDEVVRNGQGTELSRDKRCYAMNTVAMLTNRFTYLHKDHFNLYSGFGLGIDVNSGTEKDGLGRNAVLSPAINLTLLGASVNYDNFFATVEYGGMTAASHIQYVYMLKSRMFSVGVGVRF